MTRKLELFVISFITVTSCTLSFARMCNATALLYGALPLSSQPYFSRNRQRHWLHFSVALTAALAVSLMPLSVAAIRACGVFSDAAGETHLYVSELTCSASPWPSPTPPGASGTRARSSAWL